MKILGAVLCVLGALLLVFMTWANSGGEQCASFSPCSAISDDITNHTQMFWILGGSALVALSAGVVLLLRGRPDVD